MKEKDFQKRIKASLIEHGFWAFNIPDMPRTEGLRFNPEKPGDLIAMYEGVPILIECKMIKKIGKISNKILQGSKDRKLDRPFDEWHQVKSLDDFEKKGGQSYLFLNVYINEPRKPRLNMMIPIRWPNIKGILRENLFTTEILNKIMASYSVSYCKGYDMIPFVYSILDGDEEEEFVEALR